MTMLVTGGTGKTGTALAKRLHAASLPFLIASRSGSAPEPYKAVAFNWLDPSTFENPFRADSNIDRVYLVAPQVEAAHIQTFVEVARSKGVKRFVLLSSSQIEAGQLPLGQIHQYLIDSGIEYTILRPTWFQQNFGNGILATGIRDYDHTFSATENGRIAFVSTEDIAQVAFEGLTAEPTLNKELLIFGPKLYSHDEVAELLSRALGRDVAHKRFTVEGLKQIYMMNGLNEKYAEIISVMEGRVAKHVEERLFESGEEKKVTGRHSLEDYIVSNRSLWLK